MAEAPRPPRRLGASDVTLGPVARVLCTLGCLLPCWWVVRFVAGLVAFGASAASGSPSYPGSPILDVPLAALGMLLSARLVPMALHDIWQLDPRWRRADRQALQVQLRVQHALDAERAPADPIVRREAPPRW